jgi:hypothetical protein
MKYPALLFIALSASACGANAQVVYRCGSEYTQTPCPQGRIVEATDPRSAAERAEAKRVAADERRLAVQMQHDRLAEQASIKPAGASSLSGRSPTPMVERSPPKHKKRVIARWVRVDNATALVGPNRTN